MRTLAADEASVRVRQSHFKSSQFTRGVPITAFGGASQPVTITGEVASVEGVHRQMLRTVRMTMAEGPIGKPFLAEGVSDTAGLFKCAAKLSHGEWIAAKRKVPHNRHSKAVLVIVTNTPIPGPRLFRFRHTPTMPTVRNFCKWALPVRLLFRSKAAGRLPGDLTMAIASKRLEVVVSCRSE
jgi:hypothetical protein